MQKQHDFHVFVWNANFSQTLWRDNRDNLGRVKNFIKSHLQSFCTRPFNWLVAVIPTKISVISDDWTNEKVKVRKNINHMVLSIMHNIYKNLIKYIIYNIVFTITCIYNCTLLLTQHVFLKKELVILLSFSNSIYNFTNICKVVTCYFHLQNTMNKWSNILIAWFLQVPTQEIYF